MTLDTYALNHLVYPYVPQKFLPNGLDFATTVLESDRASSLLPNKDYLNYLDMINQTQEELQNWPTVIEILPEEDVPWYDAAMIDQVHTLFDFQMERDLGKDELE